MKKEDRTDVESKEIKAAFPMTRREFLKTAGTGIFVFFTLGPRTVLAQGSHSGRGRRGIPEDFNAYLRIAEEGSVSCFTGKIEMGQGIVTSLAQMLADELDVGLDAVEMVMGDTDLCPWDMGTFGSMSTRFFRPQLRAAGAEARQVLLELGAEYLETPVNEVTTEDGMVMHRGTGRKVSYGQLTKGKQIDRRASGKVELKKPKEFEIMGKPYLRRDALEKVTGAAKFAGDVQLPGMLYAAVLRPPSHDAKLLNIDLSEAKKLHGVSIVEEDDFIAVLHSSPDKAREALTKVKTQYDVPEPQLNEENIFDHLVSAAPEGQKVDGGGNLQSGLAAADIIIEHKYLDGYKAHAPIEPHTAVVEFKDGKATVWPSSQTPFRAKDQAAEVLGIKPENVRVISPFVGGGFGGKTSNLQVKEAALAAKATGKPVQLAWSRSEEFFLDTFRPAAVVKIKSGLNKEGRMILWDYHVYFAGDRGADHFYDIPHHSTVEHGSGWRGTPGSHPFATGAWRAPGNNTNTFARESQIDIMAHKAGKDPVEFRLKHLKEGKMKRLLEKAAEKFNWKPGKTPGGKGYGAACGIDAGTFVTTMAEVEVDEKTGQITVKRVLGAQDMGLSVNPEGTRIQIEGCITMGLGYALAEDIRFRGGKILDENFDTYEIPRFSWVPRIDTLVIDDKNADPQGGGEPAIITMGAVIANAVFNAVGARVFRLPVTPDRVKAAIA